MTIDLSEDMPLPKAADAALAQMLDGALAAHGIAPEPQWRAEALMHLRAIADAAHLVYSLDLGDAAEPAPVYRP
ncbi:AtzG-like protein [Xanthobacter pseudotagetidis]|uniref:AtzG-like protein n=1 Tax=Xanthobacter pseudotagetidis TaxID=3119911 RepID=UPI00372C8365